MFALTLMQGPVKILIANVRIGLYGNINSVIYRYTYTFIVCTPFIFDMSYSIGPTSFILSRKIHKVLFDKNITNSIVAVL